MSRMAAPETAGAGSSRRHFRLSGATKLGVRIIVSAALLALLITKIPADDVQPKDTHTGTLLFLAFGLGSFDVGQTLAILLVSGLIAAGAIGAMWARWILKG